MVLRSSAAAGFCKCLGRLRALPCGALHGRAQPLAQALLGAAEVHLGQRALAQRADLRQVLAELGRVLLGAPDRDLHQPGHFSQPDRVLRDGLGLENGRHQARLVVDQDQLGLGGIEQHGSLSRNTV